MSKPGLILIICPSFEESQKAFISFLDYELNFDANLILRADKFSNSIDTDDDLRYVFIPYQFEHMFDDDMPDKVQMGDFFNDLMDANYMYKKYIDGLRCI